MPAPQTNITLGTAGHIDHGKTLLIKCLTGCETDRLREEKVRGMSIDLGFAPCTIGDQEVGIVDVPGHENFIKTMVAGASGMDGVILVVAADDGVMPQTREHLEILTLLGVRHGIVALTKVDRVEPDLLELVRDEARAYLQTTFLADAPILPVSSVTGEGFGPLWTALSDLVASIEPKRLDGVFRMPVDRAFSAKGYGTIVAGIPAKGSATIDDELLLLPQGVAGRIRAIQVYGRDADAVRAGQCAALNVREWDQKAIGRGNVVTVPGYFSTHEWVVCRLELLPHEKLSLKNGATVRFHTGTSDVSAKVYLMQGDRMGAGQEGIVQLRLAEPTVLGPGDRFIVRSPSPVTTIGGGLIVEGGSRRVKRNRPGTIEDLTARAQAVLDEKRFLEYCIRACESLVAYEAELSARAKIQPKRLQAMLAELVGEGRVIEVGSGQYIHDGTLCDVGERLADIIGEYHASSPESPGLTLDASQESSGIPKETLQSLAALLKERGQLVERHHRLALPEHRGTMGDEGRELLERIEAAFRDRPFSPPGSDEVAEQVGASPDNVHAAIKTLVEHERLVPIKGGLLFHRDAVDRAGELLVAFIQKEGRLESVKFKYLLDTTRKFAIPLLDSFDKIGLTRRAGNTRYLSRTQN